MFFSKKAMSPLIATVLLIAFAVAIGTMIMNWSSGIDEEVDVDYCEGVSLSATSPACYTESGIQITLQNDGKETISGVLVQSSTEAADLDFTLKNSEMIPRESLNKEIPFSYSGGELTLSFYPTMQTKDENSQVCMQKGFSVNELIPC